MNDKTYLCEFCDTDQPQQRKQVAVSRALGPFVRSMRMFLMPNWRSYRRIRLGIIILEYAFFILYFGFLWLDAGTASARTSQYIADLVFTQFFGHFVTVILAVQIGGQQQQLVRWLIIFVYGSFGLWIMLDLTEGWLVAVIWAVSLAIGLMRDRDNVLGNALAEGGWLIVTAFIAALVGSMVGVPENSLLTEHIGTTAGWGILYYVGLLVVEWHATVPHYSR